MAKITLYKYCKTYIQPTLLSLDEGPSNVGGDWWILCCRTAYRKSCIGSTSNTTGHYFVLRIKCMILLRRHKSSQSKENIQRGNIYLSAEIHKTKTLTLRKIFLKPCLYLFNYCLVWFRISGFTKIS